MFARTCAITLSALGLASAAVLKGVVAGDVATFKAIPFAAPPVGSLRWRSPQPPPPWTGVRPAAEAGPACIQTAGASGYHGPQSEDCLTLNVYASLHRQGARLPVMVWIHGGGFLGGAGSRYDGTHFAEDGVVLVTLNYRLGKLGFFAHPALAKTNPEGELADFGLMDQIAALKWVKANIAAFGGDPGKVTLFGESAGAQSVNALLVSPLARDLFARAISESSFAAFPSATLAQARTAAMHTAEDLGIRSEDPTATAAALRAAPATDFAKPIVSLIDPGTPKPILDGVVLTRNPLEAFERGEQAKVPLIIGGNSFEASEFAGPVASAPKAVMHQLGWEPDAVLAKFGGGDPVKAAADLLTLAEVIEPDRRMARDDAKTGVAAYVYYFSYVPEASRSHTLGAWHGAEVSYVFGTLPKTAVDYMPSPLMPAHAPAAGPQEEAISRAIHAYWVAFAKTGRPGEAGGPTWPAASAREDVLMEFGADGVRLRRDFDKATLDLLETKAAAVSGGHRT
jgi:para-nitrobenzyl esterase